MSTPSQPGTAFDGELESVWSHKDYPFFEESLCIWFCRKWSVNNVFKSYKGKHVDKVIIMLKVMQKTLTFFDLNVRGFDTDSAVIAEKLNSERWTSETTPKSVIRLAQILCMDRISNPHFDIYAQFLQWTNVVNEAINLLEGFEARDDSRITSNQDSVSIAVQADEVYKCEVMVKSVSPLFKDDPVKTSYICKFEEIRKRGEELDQVTIESGTTSNRHSIYPFQCICAPIGSGKTTLALNLCCGKFPALYCTLSKLERFYKPTKYQRPFVGISQCLQHITHLDTNMLYKTDPKKFGLSYFDLNKVLECEVIQKFSDDLRFHLVGFLVAFFTYLVEARKVRPDITYLELECQLTNIKYQPMTINYGQERLKELLTRSESKTMPFLLVLDDCNHDTSHSEHSYKVLRSFCRCIQVMVVFVGKDFSISTSEKQSDWAILGFKTPKYDNDHLAERCAILTRKFAEKPPLQRIVNFVQKVAPSENPWLVNLCLDFLQKTNLDDPYEILKKMFENCCEEFQARKMEMSHFKFENSYASGQINYMYQYGCKSIQLKDSRTVAVRDCSESSSDLIKEHIASLFGYPETKDCPYFVLSAKENKCYYSRDHRTTYMPRSIYPSFKDTPITGLTLFGLSPEHEVFTFAAFYKSWKEVNCWTPRIIPGFSISLENLFFFSAIVASKARGPEGCSMSEFLAGFIHQINNKTVTVSVSNANECPWERENCQRIPMLAPMANCSWNSELCSLLNDFLPSNNLGVYRREEGRNRINGIAYYFDPSEPIEEEIEDDNVLDYESKGIKLYWCPKPIIQPQHGTLALIKTNPKKAAFAVECIRNQHGASLNDILVKLENKFTNEAVEHCNLFFIFAIKFGKNTAAGLRRRLDRNTNKYVIWSLDGDGANAFTLNKVVDAAPNNSNPKHVVMVSLKLIFGEKFDSNRKHIYCGERRR